MNVRRTSAAISAGLLTLLATSGTALAQPSDGRTIYGVTATGNRLLSFQATSPGTPTERTITGLPAGDRVVGIDFRPADGLLYALTSNAPSSSTSGQGRIYTVDKATGAATLVPGSATVSLSGSFFDVDFNPCPNALRIVSSSGQNLRVTGASLSTVVMDTNLTYAAGDPGASSTPRIGGAAYNPASGGSPCSTTLFDADYGRDTLAVQGARNFNGSGAAADNPNSGVLTTVGPLNIPAGTLLGFDIETDGTAYLATQLVSDNAPAQEATLYTVNTQTGATTKLGDIGEDLIDSIAVDTAAPGGGPNPVVPEFPLAALAPLAALGLGGIVMSIRRRRNQGAAATA